MPRVSTAGWSRTRPAPGPSGERAAHEVLQEEIAHAPGEVGGQLGVTAALEEVEAGARVASEGLSQPLGVGEADLLILAAVDQEHGDVHGEGGGGGRPGGDVDAEEEPAP